MPVREGEVVRKGVRSGMSQEGDETGSGLRRKMFSKPTRGRIRGKVDLSKTQRVSRQTCSYW